MLSKPKADGQEFINEVATIGRINHVNVVLLTRFCAKRSKCALVYDFMPNGSLEKSVFSRKGKNFLSCEQMCEISLGVARGIEYLHRDDSIVPLIIARGIMGYMAPELFYKNIGDVSYKADIYSFGMWLMKIARKRRNWNASAHSSQIYFPSWVYDQFTNRKHVEMGETMEEGKEMVMKMIVLALWLMQMKLVNRPSINNVLP
ncbi:hypothetical protein ACSBR1_008645 [Camellia fascicularis]